MSTEAEENTQSSDEGSPPRVPYEAREEHFQDEPTDVEVEDVTGADTREPEPWDPNKIRVHTKNYSVRNVVDMIAAGDLDLAPDFQRMSVWRSRQQAALIESLLLGIPLPSFYFNENRDRRLQVVDGVQRLTTIHRYLTGESFPLEDLTYLAELEGKTFSALAPVYQRRIRGTQLVVHVIDPETPYRVKFDIFRRINTGGTPLSAQEIRHCMSGPRARTFLRSLVKMDEFQQAVGPTLVNHRRMADREVALRFCAFRLFSCADYALHQSLDDFLGAATRRLDEEIDDQKLDELRLAFARGMRHAVIVFGAHAFRKWPLAAHRQNPVNRALFETWGTVLADVPEAAMARHGDEIAQQARAAMTNDWDYLASISTGTGAAKAVFKRFERARSIVDTVIGED